jgi:HEAT repeat protein
MKRVGLTSLLLMVLPALVLWGQAAPLDTYPTVEEVQPLKAQALSIINSIFQNPSHKEADRLSTVNVLDRSEDPDAVPLLIQIMLNDPFASVRRQAARSLGDFHEYQAIPALRDVAMNESLASTRWAAGVSILIMRPIELEFLKSLVSDPKVLAEAALSLQDPSTATQFPKSLWPVLEDDFIQGITNSATYDPIVRSAMMRSLLQFGTTRAIPVILGILNNPKEDSFLRGTAAYVLGQFKADESLSELIGLLESGQQAIQVGVLSALGSLADSSALTPISNLLQSSKSGELRLDAANALATFGPGAIVPLITAMNSDSSPTVRAAAISSLVQIGGDDAESAILAFVKSGYFAQCDPAACSNLALGTLSALAELGEGKLAVQLLQSSIEQLRDFLPLLFAFVEPDLIRVTTKIAGTAPEVLDLLLSDKSPYLQNLGIVAMTAVEGRAAREKILPYISADQNVLVRRAALESLSQIAVSDDVDLFSNWLLDKDRRSSLAAYSALSRVGDARALTPLLNSLFSTRFNTLLQALNAAFAYANRIEELHQAMNQLTPDNKPSSAK